MVLFNEILLTHTSREIYFVEHITLTRIVCLL